MPPSKKKQSHINLDIDTQIKNDESLKKVDKTVKSLDIFFGDNTEDNLISNNGITPIKNELLPIIDSNKIQTNKPFLTDLTSTNTENNGYLSHNEIRNRIERMTDDELSEVFKIIKGANEKYTVNKNGIFINLNSLKYTTIQEISNFLVFCENNSRIINEDEKNRLLYKQIINNH